MYVLQFRNQNLNLLWLYQRNTASTAIDLEITATWTVVTQRLITQDIIFQRGREISSHGKKNASVETRNTWKSKGISVQ